MLKRLQESFIKSDIEIEKMRKAGKLAARVLEMLIPHVQPGISTNQLDKLCHDFILDHGGSPACLGYNGYTKTICSSVNHVICHGIPNDRPLKKGDIVNLDVVVELDGYHGDTSRMYAVGQTSILANRLMQATQECLYAGIAAAKPWEPLDNVGNAIEAHANKYGYSVVVDFCGHGIGTKMHESPEVVHFANANSEVMMVPGMTFTIEPMINQGKPDVKLKPDGWTAVTRDRKLSAQAEHTILITETGREILTLRDEEDITHRT